jgi:ubiquitin-like 1-activating enzyme E1 B
MVGAGGIGCELLKDIVLLGVSEIHVVDLDTIDLSNLNRQFLFGREHIKKPKALVAKETAMGINPHVNIVAYHANIMDKPFNIKWFRSFGVVYNALDNLEARRHVNRMCLAADVPLIESGTAGFNGQVQVIVPGKTECYDCYPKPVTKTFPVCTIRSTPSQPVHCIVWAKSYLFNQLFEATEEEEELQAEASEDPEEVAKLQREANELRSLKDTIFEDGFAAKMFDKVFYTDIERLRSMDSMWKARSRPVSIKYEELEHRASSVTAQVVEIDQKVWSLEENFYVLNYSLDRLQKRLKELRAHSTNAGISFDKDDKDTLDFVAAAANIRSVIFSIPLKSEFEVKQIAGNIIPAIATTNAIIAGICVLQSLFVLNDKTDQAGNVFLSRLPERVFNTEKLQPPRPGCVVSGVARAVVKADPHKLTLGTLIDKLLKLDLGYSEDLSVVTDELLYDPDFDDNLERTLADLRITDGSFITIIDEEENGKVNLELYIESSSEEPYLLTERPAIPQKPALEDVGQKRKHSPDEVANGVSKKLKLKQPDDTGEIDDLILIDDEDDGLEIID